MSTKKVQDTHIKSLLPALHWSLIEIASVMNQPERDDELLELAGLTLERALFPLLVFVERKGPIGVVDLAARAGRDYTTVSRQVARLEELGLVERRAGSADKRVRETIVTQKGKAATDALGAAREKLAVELFREWSASDFNDLVRLIQKFARSMSGESKPLG